MLMLHVSVQFHSFLLALVKEVVAQRRRRRRRRGRRSPWQDSDGSDYEPPGREMSAC